jgi:hypothetical protein
MRIESASWYAMCGLATLAAACLGIFTREGACVGVRRVYMEGDHAR